MTTREVALRVMAYATSASTACVSSAAANTRRRATAITIANQSLEVSAVRCYKNLEAHYLNLPRSRNHHLLCAPSVLFAIISILLLCAFCHFI